ncbi:hypothetical protein BLOT_008043 [Blomia tropicalis]|nr:hypothetical protein BLOT_008043 [Blomia tropicalis]
MAKFTIDNQIIVFDLNKKKMSNLISLDHEDRHQQYLSRIMCFALLNRLLPGKKLILESASFSVKRKKKEEKKYDK